MSESEDENQHIFDEDTLKNWKKKDLTQWLVDHKKKKSGNKQVLVHRIIRSLRFDNSSNSDTESESSDGSDSESEKLPPLDVLKDGWSPVGTSICPPVREEDVENYFLYNKNPITGRSNKCHRQLKKARKFSNEDYVYDVRIHDIEAENSYCYVKAKCKPSMKDTVIVGDGNVSKYYTLHVVLVKKTGKIDSGVCNCKAGHSGVCSHIGGLLLTLVKIKSACTSRSCEWLQPQTLKKLSPKRLADIKFVNPAQEKEQPLKPYPDVYQAGPCKDPDLFLQQILAGLGQACPNSVLFQTLNPNIVDLSDVMKKYQTDIMYCDHVDLNSSVCQTEFRNFVSEIELSENEITVVKDSTKGQSSNMKWKEMRTYILTASNFGKICKKRPETKPDNIIKQTRGYEASFDTKAMRYGRKKESHARREYTRTHMRKCGSCVTVETTGLVMSKEFPYLGASVDGIVNCKTCGIGAVEIKCPYSGRNLSPKECVSLKQFCGDLDKNNNLVLKSNHNYMYQIMGQMKIVGVDWCDFIIWTKKGINVQRVHFDEKFWQNMLFRLKFFYSSFFVAELFTNRIKRGKQLMY